MTPFYSLVIKCKSFEGCIGVCSKFLISKKREASPTGAQRSEVIKC